MCFHTYVPPSSTSATLHPQQPWVKSATHTCALGEWFTERETKAKVLNWEREYSQVNTSKKNIEQNLGPEVILGMRVLEIQKVSESQTQLSPISNKENGSI